MEQSRANKISEVLKNVSTLGKNLRIPGAGPSRGIPEAKNAIGVPVQGSGFVRILMYFIAGILLIGIILLGVDQWITPIFQRTPGSPGYIPIPGTDLSQVFWKDLTQVSNITIGSVPPVAAGQVAPLSVTVLEAQTTYSLTVDVFINDEYPQVLPEGETLRIFFRIGTAASSSLEMRLDNNKNTVYITSFDNNGNEGSVTIDNVPIHSPFRIGVTVSPYIMESYLNGLLVNTKRMTHHPKAPASGDKIFALSNIKSRGDTPILLSRGIQVLNVRAFGYPVSASEMKGRMSDLTSANKFKTPDILL
jgi:hypothetical protein